MVLIKTIKVLLNRQFPQSFLIKRPLWGTIAFFIILFLFVVVYQPLRIHGARSFSLSFTMLFYCLLVSVGVFVVSSIIKRTNCFSKDDMWSVSKELFSIISVLAFIGITAYFAGFLMEYQDSRWNHATFFDSFSRSVLIGLIPVLIPSLLNIRYAFTPEIFREYQFESQNRHDEKTEKLIKIESKAKKEELSFLPDEFVYAESEGNYVIFHLIKQDKLIEVVIRNSINEIEHQLLVIPYFMRAHRAYIINLKRVISTKGNSLGYQLKLKGTNQIIPVSRAKTSNFDNRIKQFLLSIHP